VIGRLVAVAVLLVAAAPARGEGWRHAPPEGYTAAASATYVQYLKSAPAGYCLFALYNPRPRNNADPVELAEEWRGVVLKTFTPGADQTLPARTTRNNLPYVTRTAPLVDGKGGKSYGELYVITARLAIGSLLAIAGTPETFEACRPAIAGVLDSLVEPAINQPSLMRAWGRTTGDARFFYEIATDGTYRFRSERRVGSDRWILVDETGTWTIAPGQLTLAPTASTGVERSRGAVAATRKLPLERVTYEYAQHYLERANEWQLSLRPPKPTARDGAGASHVYSDRWKPDWQRF
jgi:hypothetical protein